jgi:hypothetical protein
VTASGTCGAAKAGTDPHDSCAQDPQSSCLKDGECDGQGACRKYGKTTSCGSTQCDGNKVVGLICDGLGKCGNDTTGVDCAPFLCTGGSCSKSCANDTQCVNGAYCDVQGHCVLKIDKGKPCKSKSECLSGSCVDGVCCDSDCTGQCEACDLTGKVGTCSPATGAPHGKRPACVGVGDCIGACDGTDVANCKFPGAAKACNLSCSNGQQSGGSCDGTGKCQLAAAKACDPYVCDGTSKCKVSCASDGDCVASAKCSSGKCVPRSDSGTSGDGAAGAAAGDAADQGDGAPAGPAEAPGTTTDAGGCGCRLPASSGAGSRAGLAALLVALGIALSRRRRIA